MAVISRDGLRVAHENSHTAVGFKAQRPKGISKMDAREGNRGKLAFGTGHGLPGKTLNDPVQTPELGIKILAGGFL
jgi:hypothetical protein